MGRKKSQVWSEFRRIGEAHNSTDRATCLHCRFNCQAIPERLLNHLLNNCSFCPVHIKNRLARLEQRTSTSSTAKQSKKPQTEMNERDADADSDVVLISSQSNDASEPTAQVSSKRSQQRKTTSGSSSTSCSTATAPSSCFEVTTQHHEQSYLGRREVQEIWQGQQMDFEPGLCSSERSSSASREPHVGQSLEHDPIQHEGKSIVFLCFL